MITENYVSLQLCSDTSVPANVFGVDLHHLVEKEGCETPVPLLIQKSVAEIERRGLKVCAVFSGSSMDEGRHSMSTTTEILTAKKHHQSTFCPTVILLK